MLLPKLSTPRVTLRTCYKDPQWLFLNLALTITLLTGHLFPSQLVPTLRSGTPSALVCHSHSTTPKGFFFSLANTSTFAGDFAIAITTEREAPDANPDHPLFMKGTTFNASHSAQWHTTVLPYIRKLTFNLASTTDLYFFSEMLQSPLLPGLHANITKLDMSGFHWFSGIIDNRQANPYLTLASHLPLLSDVALTLHTASITASMWGERRMVELEATDPVRAKARRVLSLRDVCAKYGLVALFECNELKRIRIVYIKSDIVTATTPTMNPEKLIVAIRDWLVVEFRKRRRQQQVFVTISQVT